MELGAESRSRSPPSRSSPSPRYVHAVVDVPQRVKEAFLDVLDLPEGERRAHLACLATRDPELARAVDGLLAAHARPGADDLLRVPFAPPTGAAWRSGQVWGDYELIEIVGEGAFAAVWRARQVSLDRAVALKLLRPGGRAAPIEQARLRAEAEAIARLDHPHIVPVHEVGEIEGAAYFSMKWLDGGTLADRRAAPWPPRRAAALLVDVARAMHHAHQRGLLHRDLKPSNVLLDGAGAPHVADFGIAKRLDEAAGTVATRTLAGSPAYMAPEQVEGGELTVTTDVWALGCILYELLGDQRAFPAETVGETLRRVVAADPVPLRAVRRDVPRDLATIVHACLRKQPARRYASADALADDLDRWLAHEPIAARRTGIVERLLLFSRRAPLAATLVGVVSALVVLLAVVATWSSIQLGARLRDQSIEQARAARLSRQAGARGEGLRLLERAAAIRDGDDLRDVRIACLARSDLEPEATLPRPVGQDARGWVDPDLTRLALATERGLLVVNARSGEAVVKLVSGSEPGYVRWSRDGRRLVEKSLAVEGPTRREHVRAWDVQRGALLLEREEAIRGRAVDLDPTGTRLVWVTASDQLAIVDVATARDSLRRPIEPGCTALVIRPDGAALALAIAGDSPRVELRSAVTGDVEKALALDSDPYQVAWLGRGDAVAIACGDGRVLVHDGFESPPRLVLAGHTAEVVDVIACPERALLATYSWDETTRLWDTLTGRELVELSARALGFDRTGQRFASLDARSWSSWRIHHGDMVRAARAHVGKAPVAVAISADGELVATVGPDGIFVWAPRSADPPCRITDRGACAAEFLSDGRTLVACATDGIVRIDAAGAAPAVLVLPGDYEDIAVAGDGSCLAALSRDRVQVLDARTFAGIRSLAGGGGLEYVTMSGDGGRVAAGSWRGSGVHVWGIDAGERPRGVRAGSAHVSAALSPDGRLLASSTGTDFELRRLEDDAVLLAIERERSFGLLPGPVAFSPDGALVVFAVGNARLRVFDARTLRTLGDLESPHRAHYVGVAFGRDGASIAAASATNLVEVWDLAAVQRAAGR